MNKACLLLTAGLMAAIFAAGDAAAASDSDHGDESHSGWKMVNAGEGRKVPVRTYENWSRAYARAQGPAAIGVDLVDAAASRVTLGVLGAEARTAMLTAILNTRTGASGRTGTPG